MSPWLSLVRWKRRDRGNEPWKIGVQNHPSATPIQWWKPWLYHCWSSLWNHGSLVNVPKPWLDMVGQSPETASCPLPWKVNQLGASWGRLSRMEMIGRWRELLNFWAGITSGDFDGLFSLMFWLWSGWWFGCHFFFSHILGCWSSQLTFIFFRGVQTTNQWFVGTSIFLWLHHGSFQRPAMKASALVPMTPRRGLQNELRFATDKKRLGFGRPWAAYCMTYTRIYSEVDRIWNVETGFRFVWCVVLWDVHVVFLQDESKFCLSCWMYNDRYSRVSTDTWPSVFAWLIPSWVNTPLRVPRGFQSKSGNVAAQFWYNHLQMPYSSFQVWLGGILQRVYGWHTASMAPSKPLRSQWYRFCALFGEVNGATAVLGGRQAWYTMLKL